MLPPKKIPSIQSIMRRMIFIPAKINIYSAAKKIGCKAFLQEEIRMMFIELY
jgi:hypothetical protein